MQIPDSRKGLANWTEFLVDVHLLQIRLRQTFCFVDIRIIGMRRKRARQSSSEPPRALFVVAAACHAPVMRALYCHVSPSPPPRSTESQCQETFEQLPCAVSRSPQRSRVCGLLQTSTDNNNVVQKPKDIEQVGLSRGVRTDDEHTL